jgi:hypothetical protein
MASVKEQFKAKFLPNKFFVIFFKKGDTVALKLYLTQAAQGTNKKIYRDVPEAVISNVHYASDSNGGNGATFQFNFVSSGDYSFKHES